MDLARDRKVALGHDDVVLPMYRTCCLARAVVLGYGNGMLPGNVGRSVARVVLGDGMHPKCTWSQSEPLLRVAMLPTLDRYPTAFCPYGTPTVP